VTKYCSAKLTKKLIAAHVKVVIWSFANAFLAFWPFLNSKKSSLVDLPQNNALNLQIFSYS